MDCIKLIEDVHYGSNSYCIQWTTITIHNGNNSYVVFGTFLGIVLLDAHFSITILFLMFVPQYASSPPACSSPCCCGSVAESGVYTGLFGLAQGFSRVPASGAEMRTAAHGPKGTWMGSRCGAPSETDGAPPGPAPPEITKGARWWWMPTWGVGDCDWASQFSRAVGRPHHPSVSSARRSATRGVLRTAQPAG